MAKDSTRQREIEYRRQCVKNTWLKLGAFGTTQQQIVDGLAADYGIEVDQSTVSRDLAAIKKAMQEQTPAELKAALLAEYEFILSETRAAWFKSLKDAETSIQELIDGGEGNPGSGQRLKASTKKEGQSGNPALLAQANAALKAIREMFGVDAAAKQEYSGSVSSYSMSKDEWLKSQKQRQTQTAETIADFEDAADE